MEKPTTSSGDDKWAEKWQKGTGPHYFPINVPQGSPKKNNDETGKGASCCPAPSNPFQSLLNVIFFLRWWSADEAEASRPSSFLGNGGIMQPSNKLPSMTTGTFILSVKRTRCKKMEDACDRLKSFVTKLRPKFFSARVLKMLWSCCWYLAGWQEASQWADTKSTFFSSVNTCPPGCYKLRDRATAGRR